MHATCKIRLLKMTQRCSLMWAALLAQPACCCKLLEALKWRVGARCSVRTKVGRCTGWKGSAVPADLEQIGTRRWWYQTCEQMHFVQHACNLLPSWYYSQSCFTWCVFTLMQHVLNTPHHMPSLCCAPFTSHIIAQGILLCCLLMC